MEKQLSLLLHSLSPAEFRVTLALYQSRIEYPLPDHVELIHLNKRSGRDWKMYRRLYGLITAECYDLVACRGPKLMETVIFLSWLAGRKGLIVEIRSSGEWLYPAYWRMKWLYRFSGAQWPVVCNNQQAADELKDYLPGRVPIHVISNGIDTRRFHPGTAGVTLRSKKVIGYAGRINPIKDLETLIEAHAMLLGQGIRSELQLIGHVDDENYLQKLKRMTVEAGSLERVRFLNPIDNIENWYREIDVFVLPSLTEGSPNTLLEAMASGCTCLVSSGANRDGILGPEAEFAIGDVAGLAEKLQTFRSNTEALAQQRVQNRERIKRRFSLEMMTEMYRALFFRLGSDV